MTSKEDVDAVIASYLDTELDPYKVKIQDLNDQYSELKELNAATEAENQTLYARIRELEALLNPAQPLVTTRGCSRPDNTFGANGYLEANGAHLVPGYRTYLSDTQIPSLVSSDSGLRRALNWLRSGPGAVLWLSVKADPGAWLDELTYDIEQKFPDQRLFITCRHEPKELYNAGASGIAQYHLYNDHLESVMANHPRWELHTILEGYYSPSVLPGYWDTMYRENQTPSWDRYNLPTDAPKVYHTMEQMFDEILAYSQSKGCEHPSIGELGSAKIASDTDVSQRAAWVGDCETYIEGKFDTVLWFNQNQHTLELPTLNGWVTQAIS